MYSTSNSIELLGYYGGDRRSCLSAWLSTFENLDIEIPERIEDRVDVIFEYVCKTKRRTPEELLNMLASEGHHTPFEKSMFDFQIHGDVASHIHVLKHRISSVNAESARYKELKSSFYIPDDWEGIEVSPSSHNFLVDFGIYGEDSFDDVLLWSDVLSYFSKLSDQLCHRCLNEIEPILGRKRAKESARYFKTYNTQLHFDWQMNFRSFVNIQNLRNSPHAQREIHQIANTMLYLVENISEKPFELCLQAFGFKSDPAWILPGVSVK